jgi:broad specificity phosphatase PhoE
MTRPNLEQSALRLLLIRHAQPAIEPGLPAHQWRLSDEGRRQSARLAGRLAGYAPGLIVSSQEPKAIETAAILAEALGAAHLTQADLGEHRRQRVSYQSPEAFLETLALFFARPDDLVFGEETARQAGDRFARGVQTALQACPQGCLAIAAHGTVISLFAAAASRTDPFPLWRSLGLPAVLVFSRPDLVLLEIIPSLEAAR